MVVKHIQNLLKLSLLIFYSNEDGSNMLLLIHSRLIGYSVNYITRIICLIR